MRTIFPVDHVYIVGHQLLAQSQSLRIWDLVVFEAVQDSHWTINFDRFGQVDFVLPRVLSKVFFQHGISHALHGHKVRITSLDSALNFRGQCREMSLVVGIDVVESGGIQ